MKQILRIVFFALLVPIGTDVRAEGDISDKIVETIEQESSSLPTAKPNQATPVSTSAQVFSQPAFWTGVGFAAGVLVFLMWAYKESARRDRDRPIDPLQWQILRFMASLCAGSAGAFITGSSLFTLNGKINTFDLSITGAAGFALFFSVWFSWPPIPSEKPVPDTRPVSLSVPPEGWTFSDTVNKLVQLEHSFARFESFTEEELNTPLRERQLAVTSLAVALEQLGSLAAPGKIRPYTVSFSSPSYTLRVIAKSER